MVVFLFYCFCATAWWWINKVYNRPISKEYSLLAHSAGALKSRDLTSRHLTTRHQIKQIATSWTSVGPRKNRTCWTISELNPVCRDSTAALTVACSFCVQLAILPALIRSPYSRGSKTAATATAARTKTKTGRCLCQQRQLQERGNRQRHRGATCWLRAGAVRT